MNANINENIVLYDWLSFTSKNHTPEDFIAALGLTHCPWTETRGARGYQDRLYFGCISIHYNGREDMGIWCEMSGQGCRNFEDLSTLPGKWDDLFAFIDSNNLHITRLDVAFDDHTGLLDIKTIERDTKEGRWIGCFRQANVNHSIYNDRPEGISVIFGSPQSKVRCRIYDKAAERGYTDGRHWVRVELQLRDGRAEEFIKIPMPIGEAFSGVLLNYLRFVTSDETDSNRSRWETAPYWYAFIGDVSRIRIFTQPGGAYNIERCRHYVFDMAGNAIDAMLQICDSFDDFVSLVNNRRCAPNPKYELIVKEHQARKEAFADKIQKYFTVEEEVL